MCADAAVAHDLTRYARISRKFPREFLLLQGRGCRWRRCLFCDYHQDISPDPLAVNAPVLAQVTGDYGELDVINSGSAPELDEGTLRLLEKTVRDRGIHTLWLEAHYLYRRALPALARRFAPATVLFRCGAETFAPNLRRAWRKGIPAAVGAPELAQFFQGICLLTCVEGQTRKGILQDIALARQYFRYASINVFCPNSTPVRRDDALYAWFMRDVLPTVQADPRLEILVNNTDLGVG